MNFSLGPRSGSAPPVLPSTSCASHPCGSLVLPLGTVSTMSINLFGGSVVVAIVVLLVVLVTDSGGSAAVRQRHTVECPSAVTGRHQSQFRDFVAHFGGHYNRIPESSSAHHSPTITSVSCRLAPVNSSKRVSR